MKKTVIAIVVATGLWVPAGAQNIDTNDTGRAILQELRQMRVSLERIADDMAQLRKNDSERKTVSGDWASSDSFQERSSDIKRLSEIKLPDHANKDQVRKYVLDIIATSKGQRSWSSRDPHVAMLTKVGKDNVDVLIEALSSTEGGCDYHVEQAIEHLADETSKPAILEALPIYNDLVTVIVRRGWESDAKQILLTELKSSRQYLPTDWITAVASLSDSNSFPLLREYFINGENKYWTYNAIKHLPIENLSGAVDEAWQRSKNGDDCNRRYMALIALEYGHMDALSALIDILTSVQSDNYGNAQEIRPAIFRVVDFRGSNEELAQWFRANRDNLRFDPKTRKFVTDK